VIAGAKIGIIFNTAIVWHDFRTNKPLYLSGLFVFKKKNRN